MEVNFEREERLAKAIEWEVRDTIVASRAKAILADGSDGYKTEWESWDGLFKKRPAFIIAIDYIEVYDYHKQLHDAFGVDMPAVIMAEQKLADGEGVRSGYAVKQIEEMMSDGMNL